MRSPSGGHLTLRGTSDPRATCPGEHVTRGDHWHSDTGLQYIGRRTVVPKSCREVVLCNVHSVAHSGVQRTYEDLRERFFWRGIF